MPPKTLGQLLVHRVETPRNPGDKAPIAGVLLHGFGAPGHDLVGLADEIAPASRGSVFFFPEALLPPRGRGFDGGARAWWMIDMASFERAMALGQVRDLSKDVPEGLAAARAAVTEVVDAITTELPGHRLVLGGFSQGAMLALDFALRDPRPIAGLALLSGTIIAEHEWTPLLEKRRGLPVFQSHGTSDPILSFDIAKRMHETIKGAGFEAELDVFSGGHTIPMTTMRKLASWLDALA